MTLQELYTALVSHDWYYNYSDDNRAYNAGRSEADSLAIARKQSPEHDTLYLEYVKYLFKDGIKPTIPNTKDEVNKE